MTETELRRLDDTIIARLKKIDSGAGAIESEFSVALANGEKRQLASLEEVLKLSNSGRWALQGLEMVSWCAQGDIWSRPSIKVAFGSTGFYEGSHYWLKNLNEDDMHVTASEMDERFERIRNWSPQPYGFHVAMALCILLVSLTIGISIVTRLAMDQSTERLKKLDELEQRWSKKQLSDPVEAILILERMRQEPPKVEIKSDLPSIGLYAVLLIVTVVIWSNWPPYNFVWGDGKTFYDRRRQLRQLMFITVALSGMALPAFRKLLGW